MGVIIGVVVLAFLLAFIIQNSRSVKVSIFTVHVRTCRSASLCCLQRSAVCCLPGSWRHCASGSSVTGCTNRNELAAAPSSDLALGSRLEHLLLHRFQQARETPGCAPLPTRGSSLR